MAEAKEVKLRILIESVYKDAGTEKAQADIEQFSKTTQESVASTSVLSSKMEAVASGTEKAQERAEQFTQAAQESVTPANMLSGKMEEVALGTEKAQEGVEQFSKTTQEGVASTSVLSGKMENVASGTEKAQEGIEQFNQATQESVASTSILSGKMEDVASDTEKAQEEVGKFNRTTRESVSSVETLSSKMKSIAWGATEKAQEGAEKFNRGMAGIGEKIGEGAEKFKRGVAVVGEKIGEGSAKLKEILPMEAIASGVMVAAGAAVTKFTVDAVRNFGNFEQGMNSVFTLLPNLSSSAMAKMSDDTRLLAVEMGRLPEEVIPALYQSLSSGVPPENVFDFLQTANQAAIGGVTDLETVVDGLTSVVNAYGTDVLSVQQASDLMFTAVNIGKTEFDQLSQSLYNVIPTAAALKVNFGDVTAAIAAMTAQGTPTSVATTQIRQLLVELSKEGTGASKVFEAMAGQSFRDFIAAGGNVQQALQYMEQAAVENKVGLNDLFSSVEAGNAALQLTGKGTEMFTNALNANAEATGVTEEAYNRMMESSTQALKQYEAAYANLSIVVGEQLVPVLTKGINLLTEGLKLGGGYFQEQTRHMVQANVENAQSIEEVKAAAERLNGVKVEGTWNKILADGSGIADELSEGYKALAIRTLALSDANVDLETALKATLGPTAEISRGRLVVNGLIVDGIKDIQTLAEEQRQLAQVEQAASFDARLMANEQAKAADALQQLNEETASFDAKFLGPAVTDAENLAEATAAISDINLSGWSAAQASAFDKQRQTAIAASGSFDIMAMAQQGVVTNTTAEASRVMAEEMERQKKVAEENAEKLKELAAASGDYFVSAMQAEAGTGLFNESLDQLGIQYVRVGGRTREQNEELSYLQETYNKAQQNIQDYELGLKGLGLTEEERNEKIAEQMLLMQNAEAAMQPLLAITGEIAEKNVQATINQDAVNQALLRAADNSGASAVQMALLGGALGVYSEEAMNAALQSALIEEKINQLAQAYTNGEISVGEMRQQLADFIEQVDEVANEAITDQQAYQDELDKTVDKTGELANAYGPVGEEIDTTKQKVDDLNAEMDFLNRTFNPEVDIQTSGLEALREASNLLNSVNNQPQNIPSLQGGGRAEARATGGPVKMGDMYWVGEQGPELFVPGASGQIVNAADSANLLEGGMGATHNTFNITVNVYSPDAAEAGEKVHQRLSAIAQAQGVDLA